MHPRERTINRVGFRKIDSQGDTTYFVLPESWKTEICAGLDPGFVARVLAGRGMLRVEAKTGKLTRAERLPGAKGTTRCYVITSRIGAGDEER